MTTARVESSVTIARNSAILLAGQVLTQAITFGLGIFIARALGDVQYGRYVAAFAFATVFTAFTSMGLDKLLTREIARRPDEASALLRDGGLMRLALSVVVCLAMVGATYVLPFGAEERLAALLAGAVTVSTSLGDFLRAVFQGFERMEYDTLTRLSERVLAAVLVVVLLLRWPTVPALIGGLLAANLAALALTAALTRRFARPGGTPAFGQGATLLKAAIPFGITATVVGVLTRMDTFLLSLLRTDAEVGWYGAAVNLVLPFALIPLAFASSLFPHLSKQAKEDVTLARPVAQASVKWILVIALPIGIGLMMLADRIVVPIFGSEFAGAVEPLQILSVGLILIFGNTVLSNILGAADRQYVVAAVVVVELALGLGLYLLLIPRLGIRGAAFATVTRDLFGFVVMAYWLGREKVLTSLVALLARFLLAGLAILAAMWALHDAGMGWMLPGGVSAYAVALVATRTITNNDRLLARQVLASWRGRLD